MSQDLAPSPFVPLHWVAETAARLRFVRIEPGGTPNRDDHRASLESELRAALAAVPAGSRQRCLDLLIEQLPLLELPGGAEDLSKIPPPADEVIEAFIALVPRLAAAERDEIVEPLLDADLLEVRSPFDDDALADVREKLKLPFPSPLETDRLGVIFAALVDAVVTLDQLVWNLWRRAAPKSAVGREHWHLDLPDLVRRSLTGDTEASATQVQHHLEATRKLIAGLLTSIESAGRLYSARYLERRSAEAIRESTRGDRVKHLLTGVDAACWKKYCAATEGVTSEGIEEEVRDVVVRHAEDLILGANRSARENDR